MGCGMLSIHAHECIAIRRDLGSLQGIREFGKRRGRFMRILKTVFVLCCLATATLFAGEASLPKVIDIPFKKFKLKNGLTLIVHEDHKAPIVAVNIWYHVGSKNEKPGRTGFAHLFEHLM